MKNQKMYEADDSMISLIRDNYNLLQSLGSFGINLGFGDKTVREVCEEQGVDTYTYLAVVNFTINGYRDLDDISKLSIPTLMHYLKASHEYFLGFQLPTIRKELVDALDEKDNLARLILKLYDDYARAIRSHMKYEEKTVFPYVEALLANEHTGDYDIETYSKHHGQTDSLLRELKSIIIKYLPSDGLHNNQLSACLYDIYNNEEWLSYHAEVEENIFIPAIRWLERKTKQNDVSAKISSMISQNDNADALSDREKDVIVSLVQGMTNCASPPTPSSHTAGTSPANCRYTVRLVSPFTPSSTILSTSPTSDYSNSCHHKARKQHSPLGVFIEAAAFQVVCR